MPTTSPNHEFLSADFLHHCRRSLHACCFHVSSVVDVTIQSSASTSVAYLRSRKCGGVAKRGASLA